MSRAEDVLYASVPTRGRLLFTLRGIMVHDAGPALDALIHKQLFGDAESHAPAYSIDERAVDRLVGELARGGLACTTERVEGTWYCTIRGAAGAGGRLATGSATTRPLAICRGLAQLGGRVRLSSGHPTPTEERKSAPPRVAAGRHYEGPRRRCEECGADFPTKGRGPSARLCSVCSWRATKAANGAAEQRPDAGAVGATGGPRRRGHPRQRPPASD